MSYLNRALFKIIITKVLRGLRALEEQSAYRKHCSDGERYREPQHELSPEGPEPAVHFGFSASR
jgi:hypothetical protein